jgi:glycosyltransferase involved in cell wall biosynthesis
MNFLNGIKRAKGKYIFPCDQDDIWDDNKIELMVKTMEKTNALLLCSDYRVIYENNSVRFPRTKISYMKNNGETEKINKMRALMLVDRPGCVYCINSKLKETMSNIWLVDESHDALAWRSAALNDGLYILHIPLISFRRHRGNASDVRNSELTERIRWARHYGKISELMLQYLSSNGGKNKKMKYLNKCIKLQNKRVKYLSNKSLIHIIGLIRYYRYYPTIITYCSDILCIIKGGLL